MSSSATKAKAKARASALSDQGEHIHPQLSTDLIELDQPEIQQNYVRIQNELQALAGKIGELEQEADEHGYVYTTLWLHKYPPRDQICASLDLF